MVPKWAESRRKLGTGHAIIFFLSSVWLLAFDFLHLNCTEKLHWSTGRSSYSCSPIMVRISVECLEHLLLPASIAQRQTDCELVWHRMPSPALLWSNGGYRTLLETKFVTSAYCTIVDEWAIRMPFGIIMTLSVLCPWRSVFWKGSMPSKVLKELLWYCLFSWLCSVLFTPVCFSRKNCSRLQH